MFLHKAMIVSFAQSFIDCKKIFFILLEHTYKIVKKYSLKYHKFFYKLINACITIMVYVWFFL